MPCAHQFTPSRQYSQYEVCSHCGTYHSTANVDPMSIYGSEYWSGKLHSTIEEQVYNVDVHTENGVTKNQFILDVILTPGRDAALEIGCAPGSLLKRLREDAGFERVIGVDVDPAYEADIRRIGGHEGPLIWGLFPDATKVLRPDCMDLIVGCDVFEHSPEPEAFLAECSRLLKPGGQLILMVPLVALGGDLPERFFDPAEHVYLHSVGNMAVMARDAGFIDLFSSWTAGHDVLEATKI